MFQLCVYLYLTKILERRAILDCRQISPRDLNELLRFGLFDRSEILISNLHKVSENSKLLFHVVSILWKVVEKLEFKFSLPLFRRKKRITFFAEPTSWKKLAEIDSPLTFFGFFQDFELVNLVRNELRIRVLQSKSLRKDAFQDSEAIVVHRRLGDYALFPDIGVLDASFFIGALDSLNAKHATVISDEPLQALEGLSCTNYSIRLHETDNVDPVIDFAIMLHSEALVISNSTFSWWAGYLGQLLSPNKLVVGPKPWRADEELCLIYSPTFNWIPATFRSP
jgi:hypothetical protein